MCDEFLVGSISLPPCIIAARAAKRIGIADQHDGKCAGREVHSLQDRSGSAVLRRESPTHVPAASPLSRANEDRCHDFDH